MIALTGPELAGLAVQGGVVLALTEIVGKFVTDPDMRDKYLPLAACVAGILVVCIDTSFTAANIFKGIVVGGTTTGLYSVAISGKGGGEVVEVPEEITPSAPEPTDNP